MENYNNPGSFPNAGLNNQLPRLIPSLPPIQGNLANGGENDTGPYVLPGLKSTGSASVGGRRGSFRSPAISTTPASSGSAMLSHDSFPPFVGSAYPPFASSPMPPYLLSGIPPGPPGPPPLPQPAQNHLHAPPVQNHQQPPPAASMLPPASLLPPARRTVPLSSLLADNDDDHVFAMPPVPPPPPVPQRILFRQNISEHEFETAAKFLQNSGRNYEIKLENLRRGFAVVDSVSGLISGPVLTVNRLADASSVVSFGDSNNNSESTARDNDAANELYMLGRKKWFDEFFTNKSVQELSNSYRFLSQTLDDRESMIRSHLAEIGDENHRIDVASDTFNAKEKKEISEKLAVLKAQLQAVNELSEISTENPRKRSRDEADNTPIDSPINMLLSQLEDCEEIRDYELQRLRNWTVFVKNRNLKTGSEDIRSIYNYMSDVVLKKLANLESFFRLQKHILENDVDSSLKEAEDNSNNAIFDMNIMSDRLLSGLGSDNNTRTRLEQKLQDLRNLAGISNSNSARNSATPPPISSLQPEIRPGKPKKGSKSHKRAKNNLDITLNNSNFSADKQAVQLELENQELLTSIFEGYSSLTTHQEFIIVTENDFTPLLDSNKLKNDDIKKMLLSNQSVAKYMRLLTKKPVVHNPHLELISRLNDSGSEASGNGKGSSENESSTAAGGRGRRSRNSRAVSVVPGKTKKSSKVKGLSSDEVEHDMVIMGRT